MSKERKPSGGRLGLFADALKNTPSNSSKFVNNVDNTAEISGNIEGGPEEGLNKRDLELLVDQLVQAGWRIKKTTRRKVNDLANQYDMEKQDIAQALLDYALKHQDKIRFQNYKIRKQS